MKSEPPMSLMNKRTLLIVALCGCERVVVIPQEASTSAEGGTMNISPDRAIDPSRCISKGGRLQDLEKSETCIVPSLPIDYRFSPEHFRIETSSDQRTVIPGGALTLRWTIRNISARREPIYFSLEHAGGTGERADWSLLSGVKLDASAVSPTPKLHFRVATLNRYGQETNRLGTSPSQVLPPKYLRIDLEPDAELLHYVTWLAFGIPAAPPPIVLDTGKKIPIKTAPIPLFPGLYHLNVDAPIAGASTVHASRFLVEVVRPGKESPSD